MLIPHRTVRTSQPQAAVGINWSNPITKGLVAVYDAGSGDMTRNLVASASPLTNNGAVVGLSDKGKVLTLNGGGYLRNSTIAPVAAAPITFLCFTRPRVDLASAGDRTIFLLSINNGYSYIYKLYSASAGNGLTAQTYDGGNSAAIIGGSYQQAGKWYFAGARWASNSSRSVFQDELSASDAGTRSAPSGINSISIGYSPWSSGETWDGDIAIPMLWNRALSDSEIKSIRENPWQIFEDEEDYLFIPAAGGGATLNASAAGSDVVSGTASLAAQVALAAVGVSVAGGSASPSVSIPLSAAGLAIAGGSANAKATVNISAAGLAQAAGQAGLSATVLLAGAAAAQAVGNATLAAQLTALASGAAQASGTANLTGGAPGALSASGSAVASGAAVLAVTIGLQATGAADASGAANGQANAPGAISAAGAAAATGWASWSSLVTLTAAGFVQAMGAGAFTVSIPLSAAGAAHAAGTAAPTMAGLVRNYRLSAAAPQRVTRIAHSAARLTTIHHGVTHG